MAKKTIPAGEYAQLLLGTDPLCYRPACRRSLIVVTDGLRQKDFQVAHIRDELPPKDASSDIGWRYWPAEDLSQDERNRSDNLILLCTPCHQLVDKREPRRFTVELLHDWKAAAESSTLVGQPGVFERLDVEEVADELTRLLLEHPQVELSLPSLPALAVDDGLAFASRSTLLFGREKEVAALRDFFGFPTSLAWWVISGGAGIGKSRLALEVCLDLEESWAKGFVDRDDEAALIGFVPEQPTVFVVDYASARAPWLASLLLDLVKRSTEEWPPVRVLVLERQAVGAPWYATATRQDRHHQSQQIMMARYAEPFELVGFDRPRMRSLLRAAMPSEASKSSIEQVVDRAFELDPAGSPLFGLIAKLESSDPELEGAGRDSVLRALVSRRLAQRTETSTAFHATSMVATAVGGLSVRDDLGRFEISDLAVDAQSLNRLPNDQLAEALAGMVPDILGELWILEELADASRQEVAAAAISAAWRHGPHRFASFVERAARDHPSHSHLTALLDVDPGSHLDEWFELAAGLVPLLRDPQSPNVLSVLAKIEEEGYKHGNFNAQLTAQFHVGNLWLQKDVGRALSCYLEVTSLSERTDDLYWKCMTNAGVAHQIAGDSREAERCWTEVIESGEASDESRACCLNNRADLHDDAGAHDASVSDRTTVLNLEETTHNRRFIALARRAKTLRGLGKFDSAQADIEGILGTNDIAPEQKNAARLLRAEWALDDGDRSRAQDELRAIVLSTRNFDSVATSAEELLAAHFG